MGSPGARITSSMATWSVGQGYPTRCHRLRTHPEALPRKTGRTPSPDSRIKRDSPFCLLNHCHPRHVKREGPSGRGREAAVQKTEGGIPLSSWDYRPNFLKKSLPLSSTRMKAGKSSTRIFQMASMPNSGYSTHSMLLILLWERTAATPPMVPR